MEKIRNIAFVSSVENLFLWLDLRVLENKLDKVIVFDKWMTDQQKKGISTLTSKFNLIIQFEKLENTNSSFWNEESLSKVSSTVAKNLNGQEDFVLTHCLDGEDGFHNSIELSKIVTNLCPKNLNYISIDYGSKHSCKVSRQEILALLSLNKIDLFISQIYYSRLNFARFLVRRMLSRRIVPEVMYNCLGLRKHVVYVKSDSYEPYRGLFFSKPDSKLNYIHNSKEYFEKFSELLVEYEDRNFLAREFYPECDGKVLNVGVHEFNRWDYVLFKVNEYHTIDIDKDYEVYGSPYFHKTIDFLDFRPTWTYDVIILFGVLGLPSRTGEDDYTLNGKYADVVIQADNLLNVGGDILFGPDIYHDPANSNEIFWDEFFNNSSIIELKYELILKRIFDNNIIYHYKKIA